MKHHSRIAASTLLAIGLATSAMGHPLSEEVIARIDASSTAAPGEPDLAEVRAATERFRDVNVALAEGYVRDPGNMCDTAPMMGQPAELGGMGIHFFRPDLLGLSGAPSERVYGDGTHTDFLRPSILIYDPHADGSLQLVAVENLVFKEAWDAAGNSEPPKFHGVPFDTMKDDPATAVDEAHMFAPHYDRHVWLYRENPNGVFAQYNPTVTCEHHVPTQTHDHSS
ncbi:hypothetical protein [Albidovulum sp.]|uniref:hypothetical protein n=1 Tax=Albidovulum sp. TaxID=1872424 RepID=UPI0025C6B229|nr:hypothetical protein [Defluviimonas sp.]